MKSYTPGPWRLDDESNREVLYGDYHTIEAGIGFLSTDPSHGKGFDMRGCCSIADASLISAAPDLLEALESLVEYVDEMHRIGHIQRPVQSSHAVAAIAKALGEQP